MIIRFLALVAIFGLVAICQIPMGIVGDSGVTCCSFYVDNAGSDAANGLTPATAWQTVAKVNGTTLTAGQSVGFKRGGTWRETLTVPSSGSAGSPITFAAYSTGANPVLSGGTVLNTSGYVLATLSDTAIFNPGDAGSQSTDSATRNWRNQIHGANITASATSIKLVVKASTTTALNITGAGIGPAATAPNASAITRITWGGGSNGTTVTANTTATSDAITYSLSNAVDQIVTIYTTSRNVRYSSNNTGDALWSNFAAPDQSQNASVTSYSSGGANAVWQILSAGGSATFAYTAAMATNPTIIWENGVPLSHKTSAAIVEGNAGSWWWDGSANLYIHASDGSNVSSNGKVYEYWNSSITENFLDNGKSWIVLDGINTVQTCGDATGSPAFCGFGQAGGSTTLGGIKLTGSHNIVRNLSSHDHNRHVFSFYTGSTNNLATNVTLYNSYSTAAVTNYGTSTAINELSHCTVHTVSSAFGNLLVNHGTATGFTVDNCTLYFDAGGTPSPIIDVYDSGSGSLTFRDNVISGPFLNLLKGESGTATFGVYRNTIDCTSATGPLFALATSTGLTATDNSAYCPSLAQFAVALTSTSTGATVKDNLFQTGLYLSADATSETSFVADYNLFYGSASGTPFTWGTTAYSFANWKTNSSGDSHSLNANPLLNSPPTDMHLQSASPAIMAGTPISGYTTGYVGAPDIGAYPLSTGIVDGGFTYWLDSVAGSNSNNGTSISTPKQTIAGLPSLSAGQTVGLKRGGSYGSVTPANSGAAGNPIVWAAYGSGSAPLTQTWQLQGLSNLMIRDIEVTGAAGSGYLNMGVAVEGANIYLERLLAHNNASDGISIDSGSSNVSVLGGKSYNNGGCSGCDSNGIGTGGLGAVSTPILIDGVELYGNVNDNIEMYGPSGGTSVITLRNSLLHDGLAGGLRTSGPGDLTITAYGNSIYNNADVGFIESGTSTTSVFLYGNTIYGNTNNGIYLAQGILTSKNNLLSTNGGSLTEIERDAGTLTSDYNLFYHPANTNFMYYQGSGGQQTFASWKTNTSQDAHSVNANPLLNNPSIGDFALQGGSPAIGAGIFIAGVSTANPPNIGAK